VEDGLTGGSIAPRRLDLIEAAAERRGIPVVGVERHRESHAAQLARNPDRPLGISDEPRRNTAYGTADLRLRMAQRRAELGEHAGAEV
jgi:hypothetical protein